MNICKHRRSPYWYFSYTIGGKMIEGSIGTTSKTLAKQIAATKKADLLFATEARSGP